MRILLVEDDPEEAQHVSKGLMETGHIVDIAANGHHGLELGAQGQHDLLIVDRMLPGLDGLSVVQGLRRGGATAPVLFLTNLAGIDDRVEGLDAGGDDYLTKPFAMAELLARVQALARRSSLARQDTVLRVGDLELDLISRQVTRAGRPIELKARELRLLEYLMRHAGRPVTKAMLLEQVWGFHFDPRTSVVETHICRLRARIDEGQEVELLQTVRGTGYILGSATQSA